MRAVPYRLTLGALVLAAAGLACAQEAVPIKRADHQTLAATAYAPRTPLCQGIALVSPGAGGSAAGYGYLGDRLSELGYLAVVMGHPESGRQALREHRRGNGLREGLEALITDPAAYRGRLLDITAARQWAQDRCPTGPSVLLGHSMGAATVMIEAGARNTVGAHGTDTFDAYIALSPQGVGDIFPDNAWSGLRKPVLLLTGTRDNELGGASWEARTEAFKNMPPGCKWLGVIAGASHMNFAGRGLGSRTETLTTQTIAAFLDGVRRSDCSAPTHRPGLELRSK